MRLTELGEGSEDTRRRVARDELLGTGKDADTVANVLTTLGYARLITVDQNEVEVAHEALIREWPTLRKWLEDDREGLRTHRRLTETAREWDAAGRKPGDLYRGTRLDQTLEWAATNGDSLNDLEREFLDASQAQVEAERREKERIEQEREEARQAQVKAANDLAAEAEARQAAAEEARRRSRIAAFASLAAVVVLAGFLGYLGWQYYQARGIRSMEDAFALQGEISQQHRRANHHGENAAGQGCD